MRKIISLLLVLCVVLLSACGGKNEEITTTETTTEITTQITTTEVTTTEATTIPTTEKATETTNEITETTRLSATTEPTNAPIPEGMSTISKNSKSIYGKNTGTSKTYTGLEPLEKVVLPVVDKDNLKGLSEQRRGHSYGVSVNGVPHENSVNNQALYGQYNGICLDTSGKKVIYLTFDCGYENGYTSKILDVLKAKKVPAAFFVTLPYLKSAPEVAARMIKEGHIVGNHSDTHPDFSKISRTQMAKEIENVDNYLRTNFGYSAPYFRFPQGAHSESALDLVNNAGFKAVFWSSAYADWDTSNQKGKQYAFDTVTARLHPGCVLLLHAVSKDNAEALGDIIDYAREQGYEFKQLP